MMRKLVTAIAALAAFLITPYFLYEAFFVQSFRFGEAEMRAAVAGTWTLELRPAEGAPRSITFQIEQARRAARASRERGWIRAAAACGHRSFIRSAEACKDASDMELKLTAVGPDRPLALRGRFHVTGLSFERGTLEIDVEGGSIYADISSTGAVLSVGAGERATATLARIHPAGA
jgi:hypothetical protein